MSDFYYDASSCMLCPRACKANRANSKTGVCGVGDELVVARATLHMWEEPCISGEEGSGTVFFSGCPLRCVFCQNGDISGGEAGKKITVKRLAEIFLEQQDRGANNINLVTPTHYVPQIIEALELVGKGNDRNTIGKLNIPVVYNTSGYENVSTLRMLKGYVDVYLPDFKYMDESLAKRYSKAADYPKVAKAALDEMYRQVGAPQFDKNDMMTGGVIVRHLVLPEHTDDSCAVVKYLFDTYGDNIYMSIMNQYTPMKNFLAGGKLADKYPELGRKITEKEYDKVVDYAIDLGVTNAFIQEGDVADESFIPTFDNEGV